MMLNVKKINCRTNFIETETLCSVGTIGPDQLRDAFTSGC